MNDVTTDFTYSATETTVNYSLLLFYYGVGNTVNIIYKVFGTINICVTTKQRMSP
jgi:hypothetical protein